MKINSNLINKLILKKEQKGKIKIKSNSRSKKKTKKKIKNKIIQKGGFIPLLSCAPCVAGAGSSLLSGLGALGIGTAGVVGASKYSAMRKSSSSIKNGKLKRTENYELNDGKKKKRYSIKQNDKTVIFKKGKNTKKKKFKTIKKANTYFNKLLQNCNKNKSLKKC